MINWPEMLRHAEDWANGFLAGATTVALIGVAGAAFVLLVHVHLKSDRHHSSREDCCEDSAAHRSAWAGWAVLNPVKITTPFIPRPFKAVRTWLDAKTGLASEYEP